MIFNPKYLDFLSKEEKHLLGAKFWQNIFWIKLEDKTINDDFLTQNADFLNWYQVTRYYPITEEKIEKFVNYVDWHCLTTFYKLSKEILIKYKDKYDKNNLIYNHYYDYKIPKYLR